MEYPVAGPSGRTLRLQIIQFHPDVFAMERALLKSVDLKNQLFPREHFAHLAKILIECLQPVENKRAELFGLLWRAFDR